MSIKQIIDYFIVNLKQINGRGVWYYTFHSGTTEVMFKTGKINDDDTFEMIIISTNTGYNNIITDYGDDPMVINTKSIKFKDAYLTPKKDWKKHYN